MMKLDNLHFLMLGTFELYFSSYFEIHNQLLYMVVTLLCYRTLEDIPPNCPWVSIIQPVSISLSSTLHYL